MTEIRIEPGAPPFGRRAAGIGLLLAVSLMAALLWHGSSKVVASLPPLQAPAIRPWDSFLSVTSPAPGKWFVVGKNGVLLSSTDGGRTWSRRELAKRGDLSWFDLYSIRFTSDGRSGWISGEDGLILHSADGGETWKAQKSGVTGRIFRIVPIDARAAVAAGVDGALIRTDDAGQTWHAQSFKGAIAFLDLAFGDASNGWAVGEFATIAHTCDGGRTWALQYGGDRSNFRAPAFMSATFSDSKRGWVAGQGGTVIQTADGGITWNQIASPIDVPIYGSHLVSAAGSEGSLWWVGAEGNLFSLPAIPSPPPASALRPVFSALVEISFAGREGIAVGVDGTIVRTQDGGKNWAQVQAK